MSIPINLDCAQLISIINECTNFKAIRCCFVEDRMRDTGSRTMDTTKGFFFTYLLMDMMARKRVRLAEVLIPQSTPERRRRERGRLFPTRRLYVRICREIAYHDFEILSMTTNICSQTPTIFIPRVWTARLWISTVPPRRVMSIDPTSMTNRKNIEEHRFS